MQREEMHEPPDSQQVNVAKRFRKKKPRPLGRGFSLQRVEVTAPPRCQGTLVILLRILREAMPRAMPVGPAKAGLPA